MKDLIIRTLKIEDIKEVSSLILSFNKVNPSKSKRLKNDIKKINKAMDDFLKSSHMRCLVAEYNKIVVGLITFTRIPSLVHGGSYQLYIDLLVVSPDYRRQGIGTMLTNEAIAIAKINKAYKVLLVVRSENLPALNLYKKLEFEYTSLAYALYL